MNEFQKKAAELFHKTVQIERFEFFGDKDLESCKLSILLFKITAAATTGPAREPLPTSSVPAVIILFKGLL